MANQLVVVAFDHFDAARRTLRSLRDLESEGRVSFEDTALVERDPDGTVHVRNEVSGATETGAVVGAILGALLGFLFPVVGIAIGAVGGAAVGASFRTGVSGDFVDEVKQSLQPGRSALFLVVRRADLDAVMAAVRPFSGEVLQTTLAPDAEEALKQALGR